jgi:hypothetical protein
MMSEGEFAVGGGWGEKNNGRVHEKHTLPIFPRGSPTLRGGLLLLLQRGCLALQHGEQRLGALEDLREEEG